MLPSLVLNPATNNPKTSGIVIVVQETPGDTSPQGVSLRQKVAPNLRAEILQILATSKGVVAQLAAIEAALEKEERIISKAHVYQIAVLLRGKTNGNDFVWGHVFNPQGT